MQAKNVSLKKRLLATILTLVTLLTIIPVNKVHAATNMTINGCCAITDTEVTVYGSINGSSIGKLYRHEGFTILNYPANGWGYIEYCTSSTVAKRGYIKLENVSYFISCIAQVNTTSGVYYGTSTSTYQKAGSVSSGEYVCMLARTGEWAYIEYNTTSGRKRGYIAYAYLNCFNENSAIGNLYTNYGGSNYKVTSSQTVYAGPGENYAVVGSVSNENVTHYITISNEIYTARYIEYYVNGTNQKKSGFIIN